VDKISGYIVWTTILYDSFDAANDYLEISEKDSVERLGMSGMRSSIAGRYLLSAGRKLEYPLLEIEDGTFTSIRSLSRSEYEGTSVGQKFHHATIVPAYLDIHMHGCAGRDVMEATPEALAEVSAYLAQHGVGAYLPTTVTATCENTVRALGGLSREIDRAQRSPNGAARPLGIHLEGPFLSTAKRGVHRAELLRAPSVESFDRYWQASEGKIMLMTIAPEIPGARETIGYATSLGVRCSLGHSNATVREARAAKEAGAKSATHTFNAMRSLDHRDPGLAAYVLDENELYAEMIADGFHVDPIMVRLYFKAKGSERVVLVTDSISATGMPDGKYKLGEMEVDVLGGRCTSGGAIAGSVLTLDRAVQNFAVFTGSGLSTAVAAASLNPARLIGQEAEWGSIEVGRHANLAVLSEEGEVLETFLGGRATIARS
jgi:N-acetylglucosamine-6-phosphate deacetylase